MLSKNGEGRNIMKTKIALHGIAASLLLTSAYFAVVSYSESFSHALGTLLATWYLMLSLIAGFGVQIALFSYIRQYSSVARRNPAGVTASGGLSAGSMIACCIHHVTDVIPALGFTALTSALVTFQPLLIAVGLLSNIIGILTILATIQRQHLYDTSGALGRIMKMNIGKVRNRISILSLAIIAGLVMTTFIGQLGLSQPVQNEPPILKSQTLHQNGLTIRVTPISLNFSQGANFEVSFDTHVRNLDFDVALVTSIQDDHNNVYMPIRWSGSPPDGHHREGTLSFGQLSESPHSIKLLMKNVFDADWVFEWKLS